MNHETETVLKQIDTNLELLKIHMRKMEEFDKYGQAHLTAEENAMFLKALEYITETGNFNLLSTFYGAAGHYGSHWCRDAFMACRDLIPPEQLYDITLQVYTVDGFDFPRDPIKDLIAIRPENYLEMLPHSLSNTNPVTVYRVSETPPDSIAQVKDEFSWTIDCHVARYYLRLRKNEMNTPCYVYRAKIRKENIIAYTSSGAQCEVIQSGCVEDITPISEELLDILCVFCQAVMDDADTNPQSGKNMCRQQDERLGVTDK